MTLKNGRIGNLQSSLFIVRKPTKALLRPGLLIQYTRTILGVRITPSFTIATD
jgi:hypothetical protein